MTTRPARLQRRLAAWADRRLLPAGLITLLLLDFAAGLNWVLSPATALTSPAYRTAKQLLPMDAYGSIFMVLAVTSALTYGRLGRRWLTGYLIAGLTAGAWAYWTVVLTLGTWGTDGASFAGTVFAGGFCALHLLFGLAITHRPLGAGRPNGS